MKAKGQTRIGRIFADGRRVDEALRTAVRDAIREHRRRDAPVVVWRDNRAAWLSVRELASGSTLSNAKRTRKHRRGSKTVPGKSRARRSTT